ncbi:SDR family NAD(P)-dependent oxidoreductase [Blastococcus mobilis]|uniref:3-oxoacyl-[acyl-carrier protein] reductase n=1 Tax=Blastococcus mobilis TaxID=1938746 RepID=A0A238Y338_9ACTN|nr:SDR family NAD(P)-dependent oxidoreductase [Blastococcus mobilis]SNR65228.1 3-oxoacyl-[acyl-carrier protein] reductase [Blastococcus mobilis]
MTLEGQVAIVTGGAGGIGSAIAKVLAEDGARVVCVDRNQEALDELTRRAREWGDDVAGRIEGAVVDIRDFEAVATCVKSVMKQHGRIDVLVNNAGTTGPARPMWETPVDYWHDMFQVHVHGTFYFMREVLPHMIERGYGRVVNIASVAGKEGNPNSSAYSAAKAAVIGLTKSGGKELAKTGVLVNVVTPGVIETRIVEQVTPSHHEYLLSKIPMGRAGQPSEVAELVRFATSPRVSFTTGSVFDISGGRTTY